jgi:hypothetical protein
MLPHEASEPQAARAMCRLTTLPGTDPAAAVHLASRHALGADLRLRPADFTDMVAAAELLGTGHAAAAQGAALIKALGAWAPCLAI